VSVVWLQTRAAPPPNTDALCAFKCLCFLNFALDVTPPCRAAAAAAHVNNMLVGRKTNGTFFCV
jgi:hypothetical protein